MNNMRVNMAALLLLQPLFNSIRSMRNKGRERLQRERELQPTHTHTPWKQRLTLKSCESTDAL